MKTYPELDMREITPSFFVARKQITRSDIKEIKKRGFKSILCNRPDNEETNQPDYQEIKKEADHLRIECAFLPLINGEINEDIIKETAHLLQTLPKPLLAYCRTGTRSITLWALANVDKMDKETRYKIMEKAGYSLQHLIKL